MPATGSTSIFGMLRAAVRTSAATSAPSMRRALERPSLSKCPRSALVLASFTLSVSITRMPPSFALAESACLSASARTFFGRPMAWLRVCGPNERPPPRNRLTRGAGALLPVHFLTGAHDICAILDLMRAALTLGQLPHDTAVNNVGARLETENGIGQRDGARFFAVERDDLEFHITRPSSVSCQRPDWRRLALPARPL